jgi:hypothetical protein
VASARVFIILLAVFVDLPFGQAKESPLDLCLSANVQLLSERPQDGWISIAENSAYLSARAAHLAAFPSDAWDAINHSIGTNNHFIEIAMFAARKAGLADNQVRAVDRALTRDFQVSGDVPSSNLLEFQQALGKALQEDLDNPREALAKRIDPVKPGTTIEAAALQSFWFFEH